MSGVLGTIRGGVGRIGGTLPFWGWMLVLLGAAILFGMPETPLVSGQFFDAVINTLGYIIMALGLNIVVGFAGLLDLGYVAFYAFGAFSAGWFMSGHFNTANIHIGVSEFAGKVPGIHVNFFIVLVIAAAFTALWGAILGFPTLRLRGDYLAIVTLAFGEIVPRVLELSQSGPFGIGNIDLSNGRQGITPVDRPYLGVPGLDNLGPIDLRPYYYIALFMLVITLFINFRLRDSRLGRAWIAVREDEVAAAAMGVHLVRVKLWAYAIGAAFGGFAGLFFGVYKNTINVDQFQFGFSVFILCMIIIGGMGNIGGVIMGAIALSMLERFILPELNSVSQSLADFDVTAISFGVFGFFLLAMMILRPEGMIPNRRRKLELHEGEHEGGEVAADEALYAVRG